MYATLVAIFDDSETYNACLPALEKIAKANNYDFVSESVEDTEINEIA